MTWYFSRRVNPLNIIVRGDKIKWLLLEVRRSEMGRMEILQGLCVPKPSGIEQSWRVTTYKEIPSGVRISQGREKPSFSWLSAPKDVTSFKFYSAIGTLALQAPLAPRATPAAKAAPFSEEIPASEIPSVPSHKALSSMNRSMLEKRPWAQTLSKNTASPSKMRKPRAHSSDMFLDFLYMFTGKPYSRNSCPGCAPDACSRFYGASSPQAVLADPSLCYNLGMRSPFYCFYLFEFVKFWPLHQTSKTSTSLQSSHEICSLWTLQQLCSSS